MIKKPVFTFGDILFFRDRFLLGTSRAYQFLFQTLRGKFGCVSMPDLQKRDLKRISGLQVGRVFRSCQNSVVISCKILTPFLAQNDSN